MERFFRQRPMMILIYGLLIMLGLYMLQLLSPMIGSVYKFFRAVLTPFIVAMIISYVLHPVVNLLNTRRVPRTIAVLLIYAIFITSLSVILMNLIPMFMEQLKELNEHLPELGLRAQILMDNFNRNELLPPSVREGINQSILKIERSISESITAFVDDIGTTINMMLMAFIIPFLVFYMLKDFKLIERTTLTFVPKKHRRETIRLLIDIDRALGNYVRGQFIVCGIVGVLAYLGYWLIGMSYPLLLASMVAIFNLIPYLGPFFGAAPGIVMASTISFKMVLLVIIVNMAVQILESNFIAPQVVGRTLEMHPLLIILVLLIGGQLAGIVGLIMAVPLYAVLKVIYQHLYLHYRRRRPT